MVAKKGAFQYLESSTAGGAKYQPSRSWCSARHGDFLRTECTKVHEYREKLAQRSRTTRNTGWG